MTIRMKIMGGLALIAIIGLAFGVVGMISTQMLKSHSDELYQLQKTGSGISTVLNAHYTWRHSLTEAVLTNTEFTGSTNPETCSFGQWLADIDSYNITDSEVLAMVNQLKSPHTAIHSGSETIKTMMAEGDLDGAVAKLEEELLPQTAQVITLLTSMESRYQTIVNDKSREIATTGDQMMMLLIILTVVMIAFAVLISMVITNSIMNPLRKITETAEKISAGDLDVSVQYSVNDQIGQLVQSFNKLIDSTRKQIAFVEAMAGGDLTTEIIPRGEKDSMNVALSRMTKSLNEMFTEIRGSATQVSMGSRQIANGAQSLAQGSTEQASTVDQLSSTISEISSKTQHNAEIAKEASTLSESIKNSAEKGSAQMGQMMQAVQEINDASGKIEKVIRVIDDIASQTNILALNAAVEAARAGSAGKGFAVVAEEVRNLAAKSAEAAKDTGKLIEDSVAKADLGMGIATETSYSLREIVDGINRSSEIVSRIAQSSEEQANSISIINTGIDQVAHVVQLNSATAQESAAASQEMSGQADILEQLISHFKVKESIAAPKTTRKNRAINPPEQDYSGYGKFDKY